MNSRPDRLYGGVRQDERIRARREKLIHAAADLYGRQGPGGASVTAICATAGLTPRYFYESFPNRDALLLAVFQRIFATLIEQVAATGDSRDRVGTILHRFLSLLVDHPEVVRMLVDLDHQSEALRRQTLALADRIARLLAPEVRSPLALAGIAGGVMRVSRSWVERGAVEPIEDVVALARRFVDAGSRPTEAR